MTTPIPIACKMGIHYEKKDPITETTYCTRCGKKTGEQQ